MWGLWLNFNAAFKRDTNTRAVWICIETLYTEYTPLHTTAGEAGSGSENQGLTSMKRMSAKESRSQRCVKIMQCNSNNCIHLLPQLYFFEQYYFCREKYVQLVQSVLYWFFTVLLKRLRNCSECPISDLVWGTNHRELNELINLYSFKIWQIIGLIPWYILWFWSEKNIKVLTITALIKDVQSTSNVLMGSFLVSR